MLKIKNDVDLKELEKFGFAKLKSAREHYLFNIDGSEYIEIIDKQIYLYINDEYYNCYTGKKFSCNIQQLGGSIWQENYIIEKKIINMLYGVQ